MVDVLKDLLGFQWRGVAFPIRRMRITLAHDLAEHKPYGVPGAQVEETGRAPLLFTAQIPFKNGIVPGKHESWSVLYPDGFRAFFNAFADGTTGILSHPEFGQVRCKGKIAHIEWSADSRDGCEVDAEWVETNDVQDQVQDILAAASPVQNAELAALDLDAQLLDIQTTPPKTTATGATGPLEPPPGLPPFKPTFEQTIASITAIADQADLLSKRIAGKIDSVGYQAQRISDALDRANDVTYWPVRQSVERMKASVATMRQKLLAANRDILLYRVPFTATLPSISIDTGAPLTDLMKLNPALLSSYAVETGAIVRYYAPR